MIVVGKAAAVWVRPILAAAGAALVAFPCAGQQSDTLRLGLADVVRLAAERSAAVQLGSLTVVRDEADVRERRSSLFPHLSLDVSHGDRTLNTASFGLDFPTPEGQEPLFDPAGEVLGPVTAADVRARLTQTLFDWSSVTKLRSAREAVAADRSSLAVARERAAATAAAAYVQARRAAGRLAARSVDVALAEDLLSVSRDLLAAGAGVRLDVTRAEAQLAAMRADLITARAETGRANLTLLRALNLPLDTPLRLNERAEEDTPADSSAESIVAEARAALDRRPDVVELDRRAAVARTDVSAIRAERLPTLSLSAGEGITGSGYDHLLNTYEWSFRVSVPVFDGMSRSAREEAGRSRVSALEIRRHDLAEQIEFEIRDALLRLEAARQLVSVSRSGLDLAEAVLEQARDRFSAGEAGSADVFTASLRVNRARTAAVDASAALSAARVTLAVARGTVMQLR